MGPVQAAATTRGARVLPGRRAPLVGAHCALLWPRVSGGAHRSARGEGGAPRTAGGWGHRSRGYGGPPKSLGSEPWRQGGGWSRAPPLCRLGTWRKRCQKRLRQDARSREAGRNGGPQLGTPPLSRDPRPNTDAVLEAGLLLSGGPRGRAPDLVLLRLWTVLEEKRTPNREQIRAKR